MYKIGNKTKIEKIEKEIKQKKNEIEVHKEWIDILTEEVQDLEFKIKRYERIQLCKL